MPSIFFGLVEKRTNGTRIHATRNHSKALLPNNAAALLALIKLKVLREAWQISWRLANVIVRFLGPHLRTIRSHGRFISYERGKSSASLEI
jgi:hypothetical protein